MNKTKRDTIRQENLVSLGFILSIGFFKNFGKVSRTYSGRFYYEYTGEKGNVSYLFEAKSVDGKIDGIYSISIRERGDDYIENIYLDIRSLRVLLLIFDGKEEYVPKIKTNKNGGVYLLWFDNGAYKYGKTNNIEKRVRAYRTHYPGDFAIYSFPEVWGFKKECEIEGFISRSPIVDRVGRESFRINYDHSYFLEHGIGTLKPPISQAPFFGLYEDIFYSQNHKAIK